MGTDTKISWCDHTFNPWRGCTPVSAGCDNCYARRDLSVKLHGIEWGPNAVRRIKAESGWSEPRKWNRAAEKAGQRRRVFCGSLMDVFEDRSELVDVRHRLFDLIGATQYLDWLLLTKRPENAKPLLNRGWRTIWDRLHRREFPNVHLGVSAETQAAADERIPALLHVPAVMRFLSLEPMLGPIDLTRVRATLSDSSVVQGTVLGTDGRTFSPCGASGRGIDWVIVGGESGPGFRPFEWDWARSIRDQCREAGVAFWMKQGAGHPKREGLEDLPKDLRIRELPNVTGN